MEDILTRLQETGSRFGLVALGVCDAHPFEDVAAQMRKRSADGRAGRLRFTYTDPDLATDVRRSFPWVARLVVGASTYLPAAGNPGAPFANTGRVARFSTSDHYQSLQQGLGAVRDVLLSRGNRAEVLVDDNRLVDRAAAVRAGIGWWGKNTMVLTPRFGPWTLLGSVATDAVLPVTGPMRRECGSCVACIPACPTGALDEPGTLDATRCISYWAQMPGTIPPSIREVWGDRLYGCDDCLEVCPPGLRWLSSAESPAGRWDLLEILSSTNDQLRVSFAHFYIPRNDPDYLRRNALVALGHCAGTDAVAVVSGFLANRRPILRAHAAWALGRIGGSEAKAFLQQAIVEESDRGVIGELEAALESVR